MSVIYLTLLITIIIIFLLWIIYENNNNTEYKTGIEHYYPYQLFQPFSTFKTVIIPYVHHAFLNQNLHRDNLIRGRIKTNEHTILIGMGRRHLDTLTSYVLNHLLQRVILYRMQKSHILQIDYENDTEIIQDLEQKRLTFGLVSAPVLARYKTTLNDVSKLNVLTNFTTEYVYGITLDGRQIANIKDACGKRVGVNARNKAVLYFLEDIGYDIQMVKYENSDMLPRLINGEIDMYVITAEFPSDTIRNLLVSHNDIRLVDMDIGVQKVPSYLDRARLNMDMLTFRNRGINTRAVLPYSDSHSDYSIGRPHFLTYQFKNILLTNGEPLVGLYEIMLELFNRLHNTYWYQWASKEYPRTMIDKNVILGFPVWLNNQNNNGVIPMNAESSRLFDNLYYNPWQA